jgi:hypothetical protein
VLISFGLVNRSADDTQFAVTYTMDLEDGQPHRILGTYDKNGDQLLRLYVDGEHVATGTVPMNTFWQSTNTLYIGRSNSGLYFNGRINGVLYSNISYNAQMAKEDYLLGVNRTSAINNKNVVAQYMLGRNEDLYGNSTNIFNVDRSGFTGTCTNATSITVKNGLITGCT